ncbi:MAG: leucine--tRNA ligase [Candidatus Woesearchaeota archaeon]|nr:MAG: leucine--tRNA ligase [Candidatus Woesearchaeota archaeon]
MSYDHRAAKEKWKAKFKELSLGEADRSEKPKFFIIWAYLTVSGFHHVGHMRGYSYTDAFARYKRLKGYNVLLCAGGHASGNGAVAKAQLVKEGDADTVAYYKAMGLSDEDVQTISTPEGFVNYFSERYIEDYQEYGFLGDWRRFTVTTFPDYQKFIQWQFLKLKENNLLVQKPYYSPVCLEHGPVAIDPSEMDLSKGGNATKTEYTLIKLAYKEPNQFIVVATLRPETMYGQTNIWLDENVRYVKARVGSETWILSREAAEKLQHQKDDVELVGELAGKEMLGTYATAPAVNRDVIILPSAFCDPTIGTGIVTSVPSDAPADWIALHDLQHDAALCKEHGLDYETIKAIEPIAIIKSPDFGLLPGKEMCEQLGVQNQHDHEKLDEAKKIVYKKGFHTGVMLENCGPYAGMRVDQAKEKMKADLIAAGQADIFFDLSEEVLCRCGKQVFIKRVDDQWFIRYSDKELTEKTKSFTKNMTIFPAQFKENLSSVLEWFSDRACARQGRWLGTPLPFDESYIVEPISDSTLYPIYYLVSKYYNEGKLSLDELNEPFFDYVFLGKGTPAKEWYQDIRKDVEYFYPLDINLGGKEHQTVHFPVFLMNHAAILPAHMQPGGIFVNWWVKSKDGKISKSKSKKGAKSIAEVGEEYSVDALRLFYANIANPFVDIIFDEEEITKHKHRLEKIYSFAEELLSTESQPNNHLDAWLSFKLEEAIRNVDQHMLAFEMKTATDVIYFQMQRHLQWYVKRGGHNLDLLKTYFSSWSVLMSMFTPYLAEELGTLLGRKELVCTSEYPVVPSIANGALLDAAEDMISRLITDTRTVLDLAKIETPSSITFIIADEWKYGFYAELARKLAQTMNPKDLISHFMGQEAYKPHSKEVIATIGKVVKNPFVLDEFGSADNDKEILQTATNLFKEEFGLVPTIVHAKDSSHQKKSQALPLKPAIVVE